MFSLICTDRQRNAEGHSASSLTLNSRAVVNPSDLRPKLAAVLGHNSLTEHEPEAGARGLGSEKRGKELLKFLERHSFARIADLNP